MIKKRLSVLVVFVMLLTNFTFLSSGVSYADAPQKDKYELASDVLAELFEIDKQLSKVGMNLEMLKKMPKRDQQYYEELVGHMIEITSDPQLKLDLVQIMSDSKIPTPNVSKPSQEAITSSDQWVYALQMAIQNKKRDSNVKDVDKEAMYMYMSHYIDIPTGIIVNGVDKSISNEQYFSAWITPDDRRVYDVYMNGMKIIDTMHGIANTALNVLDFISSIEDVQDLLLNLANFRAKLSKAAEILLTNGTPSLDDIADDYKNFTDIISRNSDPRQAAEDITKSLKDAYEYDGSKENLKFFISIGFSLGRGDIIGAFGTTLQHVGNFLNHTIRDLFNRVWWVALLRTHSYRVAMRLNRYLYH